MEDGDTPLLVKNRVRLPVSHRVLARRIPRMQDRDPALAWVLRFFGLLLLLLVFLNFELVDKLIHLEEAIFLLVHNHLILKHVLVRCDPDKGHGQLLGA